MYERSIIQMINPNPNSENNSSGIKDKLKSPIFIVILVLLLSSCCCCGGIGIFSGDKDDSESSSVSESSSESSVAETTDEVTEEPTTETSTTQTTVAETTEDTTNQENTATETTEKTTVVVSTSSENITDIVEDEYTTDIVIGAINFSLGQQDFDYEVKYNEEIDGYIANIWYDGLALGILTNSSQGEEVQEAAVNLCKTLYDSIQELDPGAHFSIFILNDLNKENVLITILDGVVINSVVSE